jgi:hypothetical protein
MMIKGEQLLRSSNFIHLTAPLDAGQLDENDSRACRS